MTADNDMPDFSNVQSGSSSITTKIYAIAGQQPVQNREKGIWRHQRVAENLRGEQGDPNKIHPGQKLKIPPRSAAPSSPL
jgi:hypothetical protein